MSQTLRRRSMQVLIKRRVLLGIAAASLSAVPAFAHHSFAMFEMDKNVTLEGTIREVQWTNPHIFIQLLAKDPATGKDVEWSIEGDSPNVLTRRGWTRKSLKAGDKVVLEIHPLKKGTYGGALATASVNGQRIGNPGYAPPPPGQPTEAKP
jgi:hypothetical protein